jgi:uncharacterized membrane protein
MTPMCDDHGAESVSDTLSTSPSASVADESIRAVARLQAQAQGRRTLAQRLGDWITVCAARESSVAFHVVWFALWVVINSGHGFFRPFDPFPFTLLTTIVSLEAIFLTLFVLASENRLTQEADRRGQLDLQVNLLAEQEMTMVLRMLKEVCEHLELRDTITSQKFLELVKRTDVSQLAEQLEHCEPEPVAASGDVALIAPTPIDAE